ncbi:hypothetical protein Tco_0575342, partial [Tanacetum coccineum]
MSVEGGGQRRCPLKEDDNGGDWDVGGLLGFMSIYICSLNHGVLLYGLWSDGKDHACQSRGKPYYNNLYQSGWLRICSEVFRP